ncbi:MAG: hypothetical protein ABMB14_30225, partial [Myxococcota bacterium]
VLHHATRLDAAGCRDDHARLGVVEARGETGRGQPYVFATFCVHPSDAGGWGLGVDFPDAGTAWGSNQAVYRLFQRAWLPLLGATALEESTEELTPPR